METKVCKSHRLEFYYQCQTCNYALLCIECFLSHDENHKIVNIKEAIIPAFLKENKITNPADIYQKLAIEMKTHHFIVELYDNPSNRNLLFIEKGKRITEIKLIDITYKKIYTHAIPISHPTFIINVHLIVENVLFFVWELRSFPIIEAKHRFFCVDLSKFPTEIKELSPIPYRMIFQNFIYYNGFIYLLGNIHKVHTVLGLKYDIKNNKWVELPSIFIQYVDGTKIKYISQDKPIICLYNNRYILSFGENAGIFDILSEEEGWHFYAFQDYKITELLHKFSIAAQSDNMALSCFNIDGKFHKIELKNGFIVNISQNNSIKLLTKRFVEFYIKNGNIWILSLFQNYELFHINLSTMILKKYKL